MNKHTIKGIICLFVISLCCSCTEGPAVAPPTDKKLSWPQREQELTSIKTWEIKGRMAIHDAQGADSASFNWQQYGPASYQLRLFGPVGTGYGTVISIPGKVTYLAPKNKTYTAENSQDLIKQQTGWYLPIDNLFYWVRGLPVPGKANVKYLDNHNHITRLTQDGWQINYRRYTAANGIDLPSKIYLHNNELQVRMIISAWGIKI